MMTQFRVRNYKALRDVTLNLMPIHVLIGPNDSGKTSILEAIAALSRSVDRPLEQAFEGRWEGRDLVWRGADCGVELGASLQTVGTTLEYDIGVAFPPQGRNLAVLHEAVATPDRPSVEFPNQRHTTFVSWSSANVISENFAPIVGEVRSALSGVHFYHWDPANLAIPAATDMSRRYRLDRSGFGLAQLLDEILGYDRRRFESLECKFRKYFNQFDGIRLIPEPAFKAPPNPTMPVLRYQESDGKGIYFLLSGGEYQLPARQVSDGVLLVLAYLAILNLPEPPNYLLVEEPENGIHPKRLETVVSILRELVQEQGRTQVIMTTHSPYVVDLFSPEEVTLCRMNEAGEVSVQTLSDSPLVEKQKSLFTLGEIWTGDGDDALSGITESSQTAGAP